MKRVYFILGCTACGKGAVGRQVARQVNGSILSVDSMKIYRRMDIGTAKPSADLRGEIPHYGIDLAEPSESFSVAQYVEHADAAVRAIHQAGRVALAVGGTSLYLKAMTEGLFEGPPADADLRRALKAQAQDRGLTALHAELAVVDPAAAQRIHPHDEKRIIRALEVYRLTGTPISQLQRQWDTGRRRYDGVLIGLCRPTANLNQRIGLRVRKMIEAGLADEVAALLAEPAGVAPQAAQAVGYAEMIEHLRGRLSFDDAVERIKINTRQLAKKQRTWQRRFETVHWFDVEADETPEHVARRIMDAVAFE